MQQPRFEIKQFRQLAGIPRIVLVVALVDVGHFSRVRYVDFMPALFDDFRHPSRLSAGFYRYPAARNACEICPEICLFHSQAELLAHLAALIQNTNVAVLIAQIDPDIKLEALPGFSLFLAPDLLLVSAGILPHSRSPFALWSASLTGSLTHPAGRPAFSFHLP